MRRSNGTGNIIKLSGTRRNPYAIRIAVRDKRDRVQQKYLSYHRTAAEAQAALDEYNSSRAEGLAPAPDKLAITLGEVYKQWSDRKYTKAGKSSVASYKASWTRLSSLKDIPARNITLDNLQDIIDKDEAEGRSQSTISNDKLLMSTLFRFAMERDIIVKDYSQFIVTPTVTAKHEKGAFSEKQITQLTNMAKEGVPWAETVLVLCYTGFRISEFLSLTAQSYNRDGNYLVGGLKTKAGKNRIVPVHSKIKPYILHWIDKGGDTIICNSKGRKISSVEYRKSAFPPIAEAIGLSNATPHWCRHTFATRMHEVGAPELEIKRLLGHANKDVTEHYTKTTLEGLRNAIDKLR